MQSSAVATKSIHAVRLWDTYWKCWVSVIGQGWWDDPSYIRGQFYRVQYPDGTVMDCHKSCFVTQPTPSYADVEAEDVVIGLVPPDSDTKPDSSDKPSEAQKGTL